MQNPFILYRLTPNPTGISLRDMRLCVGTVLLFLFYFSRHTPIWLSSISTFRNRVQFSLVLKLKSLVEVESMEYQNEILVRLLHWFAQIFCDSSSDSRQYRNKLSGLSQLTAKSQNANRSFYTTNITKRMQQLPGNRRKEINLN